MSTGEVFSEIYRTNAWNGTQTLSGPGSDVEATRSMASELLFDMNLRGITSVLDAGCGEGNWQPKMPGYIGLDIVPAAIDKAQRYNPGWDFRVADFRVDDLPAVDAVLCRDALQHLSLADGVAAIANFRSSGARYLYAGSFRNGRNVDVETGGYYEPDLTAPPFAIGRPRYRIEDGMWASGLRYPTKFLGVWELNR